MNTALKHKFHGVYALDCLPKSRKNGGYIINFDISSDPGSHWVAVFVDNKNVEYFDSFGFAPKHKPILSFLGPVYAYNSITLQPLFSKACGHFCLYFLIHRFFNQSSNEIIYVLSKSDSVFIVKNFVYRNFKYVLV